MYAVSIYRPHVSTKTNSLSSDKTAQDSPTDARPRPYAHRLGGTSVGGPERGRVEACTD